MTVLHCLFLNIPQSSTFPPIRLGTDEELAIVVENADAELDRKQLHLSRLDEAIQLNRMKLRDAESQRNKLSVEVAQLEMQVKHLKDGISTRDNLLLSALQQYNLPVFDDLPANEEQVASAVQHLNTLMRSVDASEAELKVFQTPSYVVERLFNVKCIHVPVAQALSCKFENLCFYIASRRRPKTRLSIYHHKQHKTGNNSPQSTKYAENN
ncbi:hypothetical protein PHET_10942 [Paragonimus heterotremus]|uniref:Uncharacterized protein n=1 Tax=Paragonimus heterotremus TaxID=100268 RepID=A0A8J4SQT9_9TREM|nr:hypothetical protein PHET_10942 [Paragonimus heterotremus]